MHPSLQALFNQLEVRRKATLEPFRSFSPEQLNHRPRPNQWSVAEVLSHLITAEQLSVAYLTKKIQGVDDLVAGRILDPGVADVPLRRDRPIDPVGHLRDLDVGGAHRRRRATQT